MGHHINTLPNEILCDILLSLDAKSYLVASHVCQLWRQVTRWSVLLNRHIDLHVCDEENKESELNWMMVTEPDVQEISNSKEEESSGFNGLKAPSLISKDIDFKDERYHVANGKLVQYYLYLLRLKLIGLDFYPSYRISLTEPKKLDDEWKDTDPGSLESTTGNIAETTAKVVADAVAEDITQGTSSVITESTNSSTNAESSPSISACRPYECTGISPDGSCFMTIRKLQSSQVSLLHICIYDLASDPPKLLWTFVHSHDRRVEHVVISSDKQFMGLSYRTGYVQVIDLVRARRQYEKEKRSLSADKSPESVQEIPVNNSHVVFGKQYPSSINYLAVSAQGKVLFIRSLRLGGLLVINLETGEEIDVPHYRLDLKMHLQYKDKVLSLSGWNETFVFGRATSERITKSAENGIPSNTHLWDYFKHLFEYNVSAYVPMERAIALAEPDHYIGFELVEGMGVDVRLLVQDEDLLAFKSLEEFDEHENEEDTENRQSEADQNKEEENEPEYHDGQGIADQTNGTNTANRPDNIVENEENETDRAHQESEEDGEEEGESDNGSESSSGSDSSSGLSLLNLPVSSLADINFCLSWDTTRLAVELRGALYVFVLRPKFFQGAFITRYYPHRSIKMQSEESIKDLAFITNNKLLVTYEDSLILYKFGNSFEEVKDLNINEIAA